MSDVIQIDDKWYISASTSRSDERAQVLKHNETFAVLDPSTCGRSVQVAKACITTTPVISRTSSS